MPQRLDAGAQASSAHLLRILWHYSLQALTLYLLWHYSLQALKLYERQESEQEGEPCSSFVLGKMRCHHALAEWGPLSALVEGAWSREHERDPCAAPTPAPEPEYLYEVARHGAASAWNLAALAPSATLASSHWEHMRTFAASMRHDTVSIHRAA